MDLGAPRLRPGAELVRQVLARQTPNLVSLHLSPAGGERFGSLTVASLPVAAVPDAAEALLVLWKGVFCVLEEWPNESWDLDALPYVQAEYRREHECWLEAMDAPRDAFLDWLAGRAAETVEAQHTLERPLNAPRCVPDPATVASLELEALDFLAPKALVAVLSDAWNDSQGLFAHRSRWFWVAWSTSA